MGEQSLLDEMRAAVKGDFERAQRRRETGVDAAPLPVAHEIRTPVSPSEPEPPAAVPEAPAEPEAPEPPARGLLSRLLRYSAR